MSRSYNYKKIAEKEYNISLNKIEKMMGNHTTYDNELVKYGKTLFKSKFIGVFAADNYPTKIKNGTCFIINLDKKNEPGSHWCAICKEANNDVLWVYDSFARDVHQILPTIYKNKNKIKTTEKDAEQSVSETNCGQRSLAFIDVFLKLGPLYAKWI